MVTALTVLARMAGLGRNLVFARTVGNTCLASTYQTVNTVPNILYEITAGGALASLVVPLLARAAAAGERDHVQRTASALLTWTVLVLSPVAVVVAVAAGPIAQFMLAGRDCGGAAEVGASMLRVFAPQVVLYGAGIVLTGILQAHRRFGGPALAPLLSSLVVVAAYLGYGTLAGRSTDVATLTETEQLVLSVGTTLGVAALSLSLLVPLSRLGLRLRPTLHFPAGTARAARLLGYAGMAVLLAQQASTAVVLLLGNGAFDVAVAIYVQAQTVFLLPWAVLAVPIATAVFPRLAERWDAGDRASYTRQLGAGSCVVALVCLAASAAMVAASRPLARVVYQGVPGVDSVGALAASISGFAFGLLGYGLFALLSRGLYAAHVTTPTALACVGGWLSVIGTDVSLAGLLPVRERVLALSIGNSVGMSLLAVALLAVVVARTGPEAVAGLGRVTTSGALAALVGGWAGWRLEQGMDGGGPWWALLQGAASAAAAVGIFALLVTALARSVVLDSLAVLRGGSERDPAKVGVHEPA